VASGRYNPHDESEKLDQACVGEVYRYRLLSPWMLRRI